MKCGTQTRSKSITYRVYCSTLHVLLLLLEQFTFTICDSVGDLSFQGKLTALKLTKKHAKFRELIKTFGTERKLSEEP